MFKMSRNEGWELDKGWAGMRKEHGLGLSRDSGWAWEKGWTWDKGWAGIRAKQGWRLCVGLGLSRDEGCARDMGWAGIRAEQGWWRSMGWGLGMGWELSIGRGLRIVELGGTGPRADENWELRIAEGCKGMLAEKSWDEPGSGEVAGGLSRLTNHNKKPDGDPLLTIKRYRQRASPSHDAPHQPYPLTLITYGLTSYQLSSYPSWKDTLIRNFKIARLMLGPKKCRWDSKWVIVRLVSQS